MFGSSYHWRSKKKTKQDSIQPNLSIFSKKFSIPTTWEKKKRITVHKQKSFSLVFGGLTKTIESQVLISELPHLFPPPFTRKKKIQLQNFDVISITIKLALVTPLAHLCNPMPCQLTYQHRIIIQSRNSAPGVSATSSLTPHKSFHHIFQNLKFGRWCLSSLYAFGTWKSWFLWEIGWSYELHHSVFYEYRHFKYILQRAKIYKNG